VKKLLLILFAIGGALMALAYSISPGRGNGGSSAAFEKRGVERGLLVDTVSATGAIAPRDVSVVVSPVGGQVIKIFDNAESNRFVFADEPLLQLDPSQAKVKLDQAKAAVTAARTDVSRAISQRDAAGVALKAQEELIEQNVGQKAKVEEAKFLLKAAISTVEAAQAKLKMAEKACDEAQLGLDKTIVRAPAAGVILERKVVLGQMVGPTLQDPLFKIAADLSQMIVHAQIAESDISKVSPGQDAVFTVYAQAESNVRFEGTVKQVDNMPRNIQGAVFYNTVIRVANRREPPTRDTWMRIGGVLSTTPLAPTAALPWVYLREEDPWMLRPGMTATVDVVRRRHPDAWKLPVEALSVQLDEHYQSHAAREELKDWAARSDADDWKYVWIEDPRTHKPWPIFVRINGVGANGETGIKDNQFIEVLDWDPEIKGKLDPRNAATFPQVIISAPPVNKPGIFDKPARIMS
jgi:multidrug efflux pump subunit AcrA (membrane-fusion protein)